MKLSLCCFHGSAYCKCCCVCESKAPEGANVLDSIYNPEKYECKRKLDKSLMEHQRRLKVMRGENMCDKSISSLRATKDKLRVENTKLKKDCAVFEAALDNLITSLINKNYGHLTIEGKMGAHIAIREDLILIDKVDIGCKEQEAETGRKKCRK